MMGPAASRQFMAGMVPAIMLSGLVVLAGCGRREAPVSTDDALQQRMQSLQTELGSIQDELRAQLASMQTGHGRGAYAGGPRSIAGTETVLERLHRTELSLRQAQQALDEKTLAIVSLRREQASNVETITDLSAKAERLQRAEDRRLTALQERQHALQQQEELRQHLVAAELGRLESEKRLYELITEVIQLEPSQTQEFFELQERLREEAKQRRPTPLLKNLTADTATTKERR